MKIRRGSLVFVSIVAWAVAALPIHLHGQEAVDQEIIVLLTSIDMTDDPQGRGGDERSRSELTGFSPATGDY